MSPWSRDRPWNSFSRWGWWLRNKKTNIKKNFQGRHEVFYGCTAVNEDITQDSLGHFGIQEVKRVIFLAFFEPCTPLLRFYSSLLGAACLSFVLGQIAVRLCEDLLDAAGQREGGWKWETAVKPWRGGKVLVLERFSTSGSGLWAPPPPRSRSRPAAPLPVSAVWCEPRPCGCWPGLCGVLQGACSSPARNWRDIGRLEPTVSGWWHSPGGCAVV